MKNGYDRYLDFQYGDTGGFFTRLFQAIAVADSTNIKRLAKGFPEEVDAYLLWTREGAEELLAKCTPNNPLIGRLRNEN